MVVTKTHNCQPSYRRQQHANVLTATTTCWQRRIAGCRQDSRLDATDGLDGETSLRAYMLSGRRGLPLMVETSFAHHRKIMGRIMLNRFATRFAAAIGLLGAAA